MEPSDSFLSSDRERFEAEVRSRSWSWLLALRRRLNVELQLVDGDYLPTLESAPQSTILTELLTSGAGPLRSALFAAMRNTVPQSVTIDGVQFACFAVSGESGVAGALIVARSLSGSTRTAEQTRAELEIIGPWLCSAIEAHLQAPPVSQEGSLVRLATLGRVLEEVAPASSDRELVARFADVLAVWHDLEVYGYVETAADVFTQSVSLPGADRTIIPALIQASGLPDESEFPGLAKGDAERLGFPVNRDVYVTRLNRERGSWLFVLCGPVDNQIRRQLNAYVTVLDQSIARATATAVARVVSAMTAHLLDEESQAEATASRALTELGRAVAGAAFGLTVESSSGAAVLETGVSGSAYASTVSEVRRDAMHMMALQVSLPEDRPLTPHERQVISAAADLLEPWSASLLKRQRGQRERRGGARQFDQVMDRFAGQAIERGVPVTAMVVAIAGDPTAPGLTRRWIGQLRGHLRAGDMVGLLSEGEIGLLLDDTSPDQARTIASRLQAILAADDLDAPVRTSIGFATRVPGDLATRAIVREARERALRDVS